MPHSKSGGSNWNTVKARILRQIITMQNLGLQRPIYSELRELAPVRRGMKKEIDHPTKLELPEKVITERPNKRYY